ncbi:hypothetical protein ACLB2K_057860 [Fragaria x ananassa]
MTSYSTDSPPATKHRSRRISKQNPPPRLTRDQSLRLPTDPHVRIGMYVALAHAGLAFSLALLYGVTKLLGGYWRPIQWAILCSMPLRELHTALVSFWSDSLNLGLLETLFAIPCAAVRATTASLVDFRTAICRLLKRPSLPRPKNNFRQGLNCVTTNASCFCYSLELPRLPRFVYLLTGSKDEGPQLKRLLQAAYHPRNHYLLHLDLEASDAERLDLAKYVKSESVMHAFRNAMVVGAADLVTAKGPTVMAATLHAVAILLKRAGDWDCFSKIVQWLISFALFVIIYENIGVYTLPAFLVACFVAYVLGDRSIVIDPSVTTTLSALSQRGSRLKLRNSNRVSRYITNFMFKRLKTTVAISLIMVMIIGTLVGMVFFSYKIGIEGKFAVISMKGHLEHQLEQNYNYAERVGLKKWMDENQIQEYIDDYAMKFYEAVLQNIDSWAADYNATEIVDNMRHYLTSNDSSPFDIRSNGSVGDVDHEQNISNINQPLFEKFHSIQSGVRNKEWGVIYRAIDDIFHFKEFMSMIAEEDLAKKIKAVLLHGLNLSRRLLTSSTTVLAGGANLVLFMAVSLVSGAAGLLNFLFELTVFFWLLYYLITTDSGGVMDHVLGMLPLSRSTRDRCAQVLDHAVSSVLLAAAKVTFFQGCLTYLLFRFYQIHFMYMSTSLALMSAVLQITPNWLLSIPAALQLGMEAKYIDAILLTTFHQILLEYGTTAIQDEIPGQNAYLTGLSILGGIALFPSMIEDSYSLSTLFLSFSCIGNAIGKEIHDVSKSWASRLQEYTLLIVDKRKSSLPLLQAQEIYITEMPSLFSSIAGLLVMHEV